MSDHKVALVPLATSDHQSPSLFYNDVATDTGLFAESLIYYDTVYAHCDNPIQFASFISRLIQQGLSYQQLIELLEEDALKFLKTISAHPVCVRDFWTNEPRSDIITEFIGIEESAIREPDYFEKKFLDTQLLRDSFSALSSFNEAAYNKFCDLAKKNSLVYDSEIVASGLFNNEYADFLNPKRHKLRVMTS